MQLPRFYAIIDAGLLSAKNLQLREFAEGLRDAGVNLVQYRDKNGSPRQILRNAAVLSAVFAGPGSTLIMNDRADLALLAGFDGVHVGQDDLTPNDARTVLGPGKIVGVSTHTDAQVIAANASSADYIAIGPVFATGTKLDAEPVVGLEGVRIARALTARPLVAIGGIGPSNAERVLDAGADSIALVSALLTHGKETMQTARRILLRPKMHDS